MKSWHAEGIPLAIVLEALDGCFRKIDEGKRLRVISSLSYCRHAVREIWADRRDLQIGGQGAVPEADPGAGLTKLAEDLRMLAEATSAPWLRELLGQTAGEVLGAGRNAGVPLIEERLVTIEDTLYDAIWSSLDESEQEAVQAEVSRRLGLSAETIDVAGERAARAHRRAILRTQYRIPTLSLFA